MRKPLLCISTSSIVLFAGLTLTLGLFSLIAFRTAAQLPIPGNAVYWFVDEEPALVGYDASGNGVFEEPLSPSPALSEIESFESITYDPKTELFRGIARLRDPNNNGAIKLVTIDPATLGVSFVGEEIPSLADDPAQAIDVDSVTGDIRLISDSGQNITINPDNGAFVVRESLAYAIGDPHFGSDLKVVKIASAVNALNSNQSTLYGINDANKTLVRIGGLDGVPSPNGGQVHTIGNKPFYIFDTGLSGFDIDQTTGEFIASLDIDGSTRLFEINRQLGSATPFPWSIGESGLSGLAIAPQPIFPCDTPSFSAPVNYPIGPAPLSSVAGDFNGDGHIDIASIATSPASLVVRFGDGDGGFGAPVPIALANSSPRMIAARDLDGDGDLDLIVSLFSVNSVAIYMNNGSGVFSAPVNYPAGLGPGWIAIADKDGDGDRDLAIANQNGNAVTILLNSGTGTFSPPITFPVGMVPRAVVFDDFNNDGRPDVMTADQNSNNVSLLLNTGTGLAPAISIPAGTGPVHLATDDLNGDGNTDFVVSNQSANIITVRLGNGSGGFGPPATFTAGTSTRFTAISDVDSDGKLDLLVANQVSDTISILPGDGTGNFGPPTHIPAGDGPVVIIPVDLTSDGRPDLIINNFSGNNFSILSNNCIGQEPPGTLRLVLPNMTVDEGSIVSVDVLRVSGSAGAVSCSFELSDGTATGGPSCTSGVDYVNPGPLTLNFAETVTKRSVDIRICPDAETEPDETLTITLTEATGGATIGSPSSTIVTIEDKLPPLSGTIEVGPGGDYDCLTNNGCLFEALNERGCSGDLDINLIADLTNETGTHALNELPGGCSVSIQPAGGAARHISGSSSTALMAFDGVDMCSIDGLNTNGNSLTISNTSTDGSTLLLNEVSECTVDNTTIEGVSLNQDNAVVKVEGGSDVSITNSTIGGTDGFPAELALRSDQSDRFTLFTNNFSKSKKGLYLSELKNTLVNSNTIVGGPAATGLALAILLDASPVGSNSSERNRIFGNEIKDLRAGENEPNIISGNQISGFRGGGSVTGIQLIGNTGSTIVEGNKIFDLDGTGSGPGGDIIGIDVRGSSTSAPQTVIRNNMVSLSPMSASNHSVIGIQDAGHENNIFTADHNSVYIGGPSNGLKSWALRRADSSPTNHTARNNIAYNDRSGAGDQFAYGDHSAGTGTFVAESNFFVGTGTTPGNHFDLATVFSGNPVNFATWQAGPPARDALSDSFQANTLDLADYFVNALAGDLHILPTAVGVLDEGIAGTGVLTDFDSQPRSTKAPDRGADELVSGAPTPTPTPEPTPTPTPVGSPSPSPTALPGVGLEGDLASRPNGDGNLLSNDVTLARQFVVGLLIPTEGTNEYQRADTAPLATRGDGILTAGDVTQIRRYVAGIDPTNPAGGPTSSPMRPESRVGGILEDIYSYFFGREMRVAAGSNG